MEEDKAKLLVMDYMNTFGTEAGKRVLEDLKKKSGFNFAEIPVGTDNHIDIYAVMHNEGERAVIINILRMLAKKPYEKRQTEAIKE